jgi:DNA modification methylase
VRSYLLLEKADHLRPEGIERDTFPPSMVEAFVRRYSASGELVLDPFAGFGTTLVVAEQLGRRAAGVEWHIDRASYIDRQTSDHAIIIYGDSRKIDELGLPPADFVITSPPYMNRGDEQDPLQGYEVAGEGYDAYLSRLQDVFRRLGSVLKPDRFCVVNVANMKRHDGLTTLAWDVGRALSDVMTFEGEVVVCWQDGETATSGARGAPLSEIGSVFGYDHEYCLVFRNSHRTPS